MGVRWYLAYQWNFENLQKPEVQEYLMQNYEIAQIAVIGTGQQGPLYILFQKGGPMEAENLDVALQNFGVGKVMQSKSYETSRGPIVVSYASK